MNLLTHLLYTPLLIDVKHIFINVIYIFIFLLVVLFIFIAAYSIYAHRREINKKRWEEGIADLINEAIFSEDETGLVDIHKQPGKLLNNAHYRQCCIDEIIKTRKALSATSGHGLKTLYERLNLDKDSFKKLSRRSWQKKAKGIQELSLMEQGKYVKNIFRLTTHKNETVRNEAQCGLVSYYGFLGLRFLNVTLHPISEWQQIQLLNKLSAVKSENTAMLSRWLKSDMESVVIFSIKLAAFYKNFAVYDTVMHCLQHRNEKVKMHVLKYLETIPAEDAPDRIIKEYATADKIFRLAIIDTLKQIGNIKQVAFLLIQLNDRDDDIKAAAAKALTSIHPSGGAFLQTYSYAEIYPWKTIFQQVKNELAA
ncbi:MAG: HEAT repeat domain-containing protein [Ferruginibacter sp.]